MSQYVSNSISAEARRSGHRPSPGTEEESLLIYNYNTNYTGKTGGRQGKEDDFQQIYFFPPFDKSQEGDDVTKKGKTA